MNNKTNYYTDYFFDKQNFEEEKNCQSLSL